MCLSNINIYKTQKRVTWIYSKMVCEVEISMGSCAASHRDDPPAPETLFCVMRDFEVSTFPVLAMANC